MQSNLMRARSILVHRKSVLTMYASAPRSSKISVSVNHMTDVESTTEGFNFYHKKGHQLREMLFFSGAIVV